MIVVPAIDIRHGKVVRLRQGRSEEQTTYGHDPAEAARRWEGEGAERLHLVDLDAHPVRAPRERVLDEGGGRSRRHRAELSRNRSVPGRTRCLRGRPGTRRVPSRE